MRGGGNFGTSPSHGQSAIAAAGAQKCAKANEICDAVSAPPQVHVSHSFRPFALKNTPLGLPGRGASACVGELASSAQKLESWLVLLPDTGKSVAGSIFHNTTQIHESARIPQCKTRLEGGRPS